VSETFVEPFPRLSEPALEGYHLLPTVRGDFLLKLGRLDEARPEFERAAALTRNARERDLLLDRARACAGDSTPPQHQ
jgi:RNA polymerase sigma-70 factor, ECF subfamily